MSTDSQKTVSLTYFRAPKTLVRRFIAKRTLKSATILGIILVLYMLSKASAYLTTYNTEAAREKLAVSLGNNVGIEALVGVAHHIDTVAGYVTWNFLCLIAAGGAIWALLLAVKTFRGEEDSGRWELLLAGQTTPRKAAINALIGLSSGLIIVYALITLGILAIGHLHGANFTIRSSLFFAVALIAGAAEFLAVGALASQLMPVRSRAVGLAVAIFGVSYMARLTADTSSAHWLLSISPLGWIERLQPMYDSKPLWLLPIGGFIALLIGLTIFLAGRRDLGEGIFADKDTAKPHTQLLRTPFTAAIRLTWLNSLGWLTAIVLFAFIYGQLAKGSIINALGQALSDKHGYNSHLERISHTNSLSIAAFLGITFLMTMLFAMFYATSAVARIREDEAQGYLDNFLVRPVSRLRWLRGRVILIVFVLVAASTLSAVAVWAGQIGQQSGISLHTLLSASVNAIVPAILILGIGLFVYGMMPRLFSIVTYGTIAWSFLIVMLSSGLNINHWLLDTSILHQISLAPAVSANWTTNGTLITIGAVLAAIGAWRFNTRDLQGE